MVQRGLYQPGARPQNPAALHFRPGKVHTLGGAVFSKRGVMVVKIEPFGVEQWMGRWETLAVNNIAETCVHSLTLEELLELSGDADAVSQALRETWLGYGDIVGSPRLRRAIAALYGERIGADNVLTANGAIGANFLALYALTEPGTTVVSVQPTYQQLYAVPASLGADVRAVRLREEDAYLPDPEAIRAAAGEKTGLGKDLKTVADPEHRAARGVVLHDRLWPEIA